MSAALQLPFVWGAAVARPMWHASAEEEVEQLPARPEIELACDAADVNDECDVNRPHISLAFYRKHAENMLRRYLYASMVVGRTPSFMDEPVRGGRATCTKMRTFEDAVIYVLDMENCLRSLSALDRMLLSRIVLQEYTEVETAQMLGISVRSVIYKLHQALDKVTEFLLDAGLLDLPQH